MSTLSSVIDAAEDRVFDAFCRRIKVDNIREYEGRQLKLAQEEGDARLRFSTQIARLTTQYVHLRYFGVISLKLFRSTFEAERLQEARERVTKLEEMAASEKAALVTLQENLQAAEAELEEAEIGIQGLKEELKELTTIFEDKSRELDRVKREHDKASKALDKVLKDISSRVSRRALQ